MICADGLGWLSGSDRRRVGLHNLNVVEGSNQRKVPERDISLETDPFIKLQIAYSHHAFGFLEGQNLEMSILLLVKPHEILVYGFELENVDLQCSYILIGGIKAGNGNDLSHNLSESSFTAATVGCPKKEYCLRRSIDIVY